MPPARTHFCARGGALVVALLEAQENVLELVHPRVGEEQRGIADGHERGTAHDAMAVGGEKVQKSAPNFVACEHVCVYGSDCELSQRHADAATRLARYVAAA